MLISLFKQEEQVEVEVVAAAAEQVDYVLV
jgi:hypothetical protein